MVCFACCLYNNQKTDNKLSLTKVADNLNRRYDTCHLVDYRCRTTTCNNACVRKIKTFFPYSTTKGNNGNMNLYSTFI